MRCCGRSPTRTADRSCASSSTPSCLRAGSRRTFTLTQQAVSQHIGVLKQAGLLTERREGTRRLYALHRESLEPVRELLSEFWPDALARLKNAVETAHPRPPKREP